MARNSNDVIIDSTLTLLAKYESLQEKEQFIRLREVINHLRIYKGLNLPETYIQKTLDENFSARYIGNEVVYFIRLKK